jgi:hypothetical protein
MSAKPQEKPESNPSQKPESNPSEKEVVMDVKETGAKTRKRRRRKAAADGGEPTTVTKADADVSTSVPVPATVARKVIPAVTSITVPVKKPVVVLAPPKKKVPKVLLVPKGTPTVKPIVKKTFKAKRVAVTINNTAKTQKQHRSIVQDVDAMTDDQVRAAACSVKLSRRETVGKAPITLLRQMIKDYQIMKKMLH